LFGIQEFIGVLLIVFSISCSTLGFDYVSTRCDVGLPVRSVPITVFGAPLPRQLSTLRFPFLISHPIGFACFFAPVFIVNFCASYAVGSQAAGVPSILIKLCGRFYIPAPGASFFARRSPGSPVFGREARGVFVSAYFLAGTAVGVQSIRTTMQFAEICYRQIVPATAASLGHAGTRYVGGSRTAAARIRPTSPE
jgi:hypothetical protein